MFNIIKFIFIYYFLLNNNFIKGYFETCLWRILYSKILFDHRITLAVGIRNYTYSSHIIKKLPPGYDSCRNIWFNAKFNYELGSLNSNKKRLYTIININMKSTFVLPLCCSSYACLT